MDCQNYFNNQIRGEGRKPKGITRSNLCIKINDKIYIACVQALHPKCPNWKRKGKNIPSLPMPSRKKIKILEIYLVLCQAVTAQYWKKIFNIKLSLSHYLLIYGKYSFHIQPAFYITNSGKSKVLRSSKVFCLRVQILTIDNLVSNLSSKTAMWPWEGY